MSTPIIHGIGMPRNIHEFKLTGNEQYIKIEQSLTIDLLECERNTSIVITKNSVVTINRIETAQLVNSFLRVEIMAGSSLILKSRAIFHRLIIGGYVEGGEIAIKSGGELTITTGAVLNCNRLELHEQATANVHSDATIGSKSRKFTLDSLELRAHSSMDYRDERVTLTFAEFTMRTGSRLTTISNAKFIRLNAVNANINSDAEITCAGGGYDYETETNHSITYAAEYGNGSIFARGGGVIILTISNILHLDGDLKADAFNNKIIYGSNGGSIHVEAKRLRGFGIISAGGGKGTSGGRGGQVSIILESGDFSEFLGDVIVKGGQGSIDNGAAGIFYLRHISAGVRNDIIRINNYNQITFMVTKITLPAFKTRLEILGESFVTLNGAKTFEFDRIYGDGTATLRVESDQTIILAKSYGIFTPFAIPFRIEITRRGRISLPPRIRIDVAGDSKRPSLLLDGGLLDAGEITVARRAYIRVTCNAYNQRLTGELGPERELALKAAYLYARFHVDCNDTFALHVRYALKLFTGAVLRVHNLRLTADRLQIAYGSSIVADYVNYDTAPVVNGLYFDPELLIIGNPGANGSRGGGCIHISASQLYNDGVISSKGEASNSSTGGNGGSVVIETVSVAGSGTIDVSGGQGGGDGGHIYLTARAGVVRQIFTVNGGTGLGYVGAAGYAYVESVTDGIARKRLEFRNIGASGALPVTLQLRSGSTWLLDELSLDNNVMLVLNGLGTRMIFLVDFYLIM